MPTAVDAGFASALRTATSADHSSAEGGEFLGALFSGTFTVDDYFRLVSAHHAIYVTLESVSDGFHHDPVVGPFVDRTLYRRERLAADVARVASLVRRPSDAPGPAVREYCDRIAAAREHPARFLAHHYTRYLGDLSGGLMIHRRLVHEFPELVGADTFYEFGDLGDLSAFKAAYRTRLDATPFDETEQLIVIDEVRTAYRHNVNVFVESHRTRSSDPVVQW